MVHKPDSYLTAEELDSFRRGEMPSFLLEKVREALISAARKLMTDKKLQELRHTERLKNLTLHTFTPDQSLPREEAMQPIGDLYMRNIVRDETFIALANGDIPTFVTSLRDEGGMLNRWVPTPLEDAIYRHLNPSHTSVMDQTYEALTAPESPGVFRMYVMRDQYDIIRATMSCRLPPRDPARMAAYNTHIKQAFHEDRVRIDREWSQSILSDPSRVMEWDTMNIDPRYRGAGTLIFAHAMARIQEEYGNAMPKIIYHYRINGVKIRNMYQVRDGACHPLLYEPLESDIGHNDISAKFTSKLGSGDIGYRMPDNEPVVRELPHNMLIAATPKWRYSAGHWAIMKELTIKAVDRLGFSGRAILES